MFNKLGMFLFFNQVILYLGIFFEDIVLYVKLYV